jgi:NAD(P)-dependent dehydrogenase (short-subunit alcohol dehydrogenase family)
VTGGANGIGAAVVRGFVARGGKMRHSTGHLAHGFHGSFDRGNSPWSLCCQGSGRAVPLRSRAAAIGRDRRWLEPRRYVFGARG